MKTYLLTASFLTLTTVAFAQQPANPFGQDGCWTGQQWVPKSHELCPAAQTPQLKPVSGSPVPPVDDEYEFVDPYPGVSSGGVKMPVLVRTKNPALWFQVGKTYRFAYDITIKVTSMDYRCAQVSSIYVCDFFHVATVVDSGSFVGEGSNVGDVHLFRLFSPQGNWTEVKE